MNGQRPNSNNITIDGVANIDTGDNGGNMATTNIDAVAEFKILTNAYQAEYGRAVGGQLQVVTKSGSRDFHGSGYWYGRRSDWNANTWLNKRVTPEIQPAKTSRNDRGYTIGGPIFMPGFNEDKKRLFFFFSQEFQRAHEPGERAAGPRAYGPRAGRQLLTERRHQRQPVPLHPRLSARAGESRLGLQRDRPARLFCRRRRARQDPREPSLCARAGRSQHLPDAELLGRLRPQLHEPGPRPARRAAKTSSAWTSRPRTTGASPAVT